MWANLNTTDHKKNNNKGITVGSGTPLRDLTTVLVGGLWSGTQKEVGAAIPGYHGSK